MLILARIVLLLLEDHGDLAVRSRLRSRRVPGSKPDSTEDGLGAPKIIRMGPNVNPLVWCQLRLRFRHLTAAQNEEVRPKTALVFLQNKKLMKLNFFCWWIRSHFFPSRLAIVVF
ncbi:hypothetical protein AVEN_237414-1 [Araneus ventricosus]|uniref:Secreted protein n=1 Tax=Araneus ventricosus TaxID=182803 RepID=A0A4Y2PU78_ARAVE|nr:hypothetical protein AVEN_237414-1 [Araneus ventricosus]